MARTKKDWKNKKLQHDRIHRVMTNKTREFPYNNLIIQSILFTASNKARQHFRHLWALYTPPPGSSFIMKLFLPLTLFLLRNHNTNRKSLNIAYNFRREKPKPLMKTWKAQSNYCVPFLSSGAWHTFYSADKLNFVFDISYKSSVKRTTNWVIHHIKLATFTSFWKGFMSQHTFVLKAMKTLLKAS